MRNSIKLILGSLFVYLAVVMGAAGACSSGVDIAGAGGVGEPLGSSTGRGSGAAMDPVPTASADPIPGSRLRSVYVSGFDGSKQWVGWHDTILGTRCAFGATEDGAVRCLPVLAFAQTGFADASCTVPLMFTSSPTCSPKPVYAGLVGTCGGFAKVVRVASQLNFTTWYANTGGSCFGINVDPDNVYYALGDEVPLTDFVGGISEME